MASSPIALQPINSPSPNITPQNSGLNSHASIGPSFSSTIRPSSQSSAQVQTTPPTSLSLTNPSPSAAQSRSPSTTVAPTSAPSPSPKNPLLTFWKHTILPPLKYSLKFIIAFLIYILTLYTAFTSTSRHTILGNLNPSYGTWFLQILAKSGDIAFAFAVEDAFDTLTWRRLREEKSIAGPAAFGGIRLDWFLALMSSTGVEGLVRLLTKAIKSRFRRWWWTRRRTPPGLPLPERHGGGWWAFVRLMFILALIPGPGIILMANIRQGPVFFPNTPHPISAGLAAYDPSLARGYGTVWGAEIGKLAQTMLRDRSITYALSPINPLCKKSESCTSLLIAGAYRTIAPRPFAVEPKDDKELDSYMVFDAPYFQVDMWDIEESEGWTVSMSRDCTLYGGFNVSSSYSLMLCIKADTTDDGVLGAGWKSCQLGYTPEGECLYPGAPNNGSGWATRFQFHQRTATLTISRDDLTIREVRHLSSPKPVTNINASALFSSVNQILYQPLTVTTDARFDVKSQQYVLTQVIGSQLWNSLIPNANRAPFAREWLHNLLMMPIYLFQPTVLAWSSQLPGLNDTDGTKPQPNLPLENYVTGALCTSSVRAVPGNATVIAYAVTAGLLIVFIGTAKLIATLWPSIETSEFPMLDYEVLTRVVDDGAQEVSLRQVFDGKEYEEGAILDEIGGLRIGLRREYVV